MSRTSFSWNLVLVFFVTHVLSRLLSTHACTLPDYLQWQEGDEEFNWHSRIRNGGARETAYAVRHNVIEIRHGSSTPKSVRWKCALSYHGKFLLKRKNPETSLHLSVCVKFLRRSASIVQVMWSKESDTLDPALCEDNNLDLDPWPLVSFKRVTGDYSPSPFRGGFSMRTTDSETGENGCNYMHRPMKFESDCLTGEGVLFDFISEGCLPGSTVMFVKQRTLPVTSWRHKGNYYVILRRRDDEDLFCLRMPAKDDDHVNAFLFTDLACLTEETSVLLNVPPSRGVRYLILHLHRYVYRNLCDDEYPQCSAVTCNRYLRHECHKSCEMCDVDTPPPTCTFPKRLRKLWYQTDTNGFNMINVTESDLFVEKVGHFQCVTFPDSPQRKTRMYTTVSMFDNGCRPRYTCVKFKKLGPSVMRYTLSRSYVWPSLEKDIGQAMCSNNQFGMDPEPINDLYRSHEDAGKPVISDVDVPERVPCNLSSSFTVTVRLPDGSLCQGSLHEHCEDNTRLRLQFLAGCGQTVNGGESILSPYRTESSSMPWTGPSHADYSCLAHFEGHYWERMLLLQNVRNTHDARCLIFTQLDVSEALMMVAGQCDKHSWNYARAGLRTPLLTLQLRPDEFPCRYLPVTQPPSTTSPTSLDSSAGLKMETVNYSGSKGPGTSSPSPVVSFTVNIPQSSQPSHKQRMSAAYEESREGEKIQNDYRPELFPAGNKHDSAEVSDAANTRITLVSRFAMVLFVVCLHWINR